MTVKGRFDKDIEISWDTFKEIVQEVVPEEDRESTSQLILLGAKLGVNLGAICAIKAIRETLEASKMHGRSITAKQIIRCHMELESAIAEDVERLKKKSAHVGNDDPA